MRELQDIVEVVNACEIDARGAQLSDAISARLPAGFQFNGLGDQCLTEKVRGLTGEQRPGRLCVRELGTRGPIHDDVERRQLAVGDVVQGDPNLCRPRTSRLRKGPHSPLIGRVGRFVGHLWCVLLMAIERLHTVKREIR